MLMTFTELDLTSPQYNLDMSFVLVSTHNGLLNNLDLWHSLTS
jgi:hypothetical protein